MDMRGRLLALAVFGLLAAVLAWVAFSLQRAVVRAEQELAARSSTSQSSGSPERIPRETSALARTDSFVQPRSELLRAQVDRLPARLDRLSQLLEQKTADYEALKADFDKSNELLNELLAPEPNAVPIVASRSVEPDAEKPKPADEMLAELKAELRETRAELLALEKEAAVNELHILELEDLRRYHEAAASRALVRASSAAAPALADLLSDRRAETRRWAATVLGEIGPDASAAVDALRDALSDPDEDVRIAARKALRRIENP